MFYENMNELYESFRPYIECLGSNLDFEVPDVSDPSALADVGWNTLRQLVEREGHCDVETLADVYFFLCSLKKFRLGGDPQKREEAAIDGFLLRNERVNAIRPPVYILAKAKELLARALPEPDSRVCQVDGRFGPGQVAEKLTQVARWNYIWRDYPDFVCDPANLFSMSAMRVDDSLQGSSRLRAVPKTYKKDRLITVEPFVNSFLQQWTRKLILLSVHLGPLAGTIMDQFQGECFVTDAAGLRSTWFSEISLRIRNQYGVAARCSDDHRLWERFKTRSVCALRQAGKAVRASMDGSFATLDLRDASDSIPWTVVIDIFPAWLTPYLERCRTPYIVTPSGETRRLNMYGGMGNGTTFVVETLYFWSIVVAIQEYMGNQWCGCRVNPYDTTVFGDDIIVKTSVANQVKFRSLLSECGLELSPEKSSWSLGPGFREACGAIGAKGVRLPPQIWTYGAKGARAPFAIADYLNRLIRTKGLRLVYAVDVLKKQTSIPVIKQQREFSEIPASDFVLDPTWAFEETRYTVPTSRWEPNLQLEQWKVKIVEQGVERRIDANRITHGELKGVLSGHLKPSRKSRKRQTFDIKGRETRISEVWI